MARNTVQFQKGLSEPEFERQYGNEAQCRAAVVASRWPNGFECPVGGGKHSVVKSRDPLSMHRLPSADVADRRNDLRVRPNCRCACGSGRFYHVTQSKQGISSIELGRRLGVTQTTGWKIKHKLKQVMLERDAGIAADRTR